MKLARRYRLVLVTAPDRKTARALARAALDARLIACANLVPGVESHYRWRGKIERGAETLLLIKTTSACLDRLEKLILARHPYDTPEFVVLDLRGGSRRYLDWVGECCSANEGSPRRRSAARPQPRRSSPRRRGGAE